MKIIDNDVLHSWKDHRTNSGKLYRYAFVKNTEGYIDIAIQTPRTGRSEDWEITHKLPLDQSTNGITKICIRREKRLAVTSFHIAFGIMKEYCEMHAHYIDTGETIDEQLSSS